MAKTHQKQNGWNEIKVQGVEYYLVEKVEAEELKDALDVAKTLEKSVFKMLESKWNSFSTAVMQKLEKGMYLEGGKGYTEASSIPGGFDKLPNEKKASELASMLYDKLPKNNRHGSRFKAFYSDLERELGLPLYEFHKDRLRKAHRAEDGKFPFRKADSLFLLAEGRESEIYKYAKEYTFKFMVREGA